MICGNLIMFSRSLCRDYRWLFSHDELEPPDKQLLIRDYDSFERNKNLYKNKPHLFIRRLSKGIAVYKFYETDKLDQDSRNINALIGFFFSGLDYKLCDVLLEYISGYIYDFPAFFDSYQDDISDSLDNSTHVVNLSLDSIIDEYIRRQNNAITVNLISAFLIDCPKSSFYISENGVTQIKDESLPQSRIYGRKMEECYAATKTDVKNIQQKEKNRKDKEYSIRKEKGLFSFFNGK